MENIGNETIVKRGFLVDEVEIDGGETMLSETSIPITLSKQGDEFVVSIDSVEWVRTENSVHASILYEVLRENVTEYMEYKALQ
jgi:hypothetical protein